MRILVVEDEKALSVVLTKALKQAGFDVRAVDDGESALYEVMNGYDVVLTDIMLPKLNGIELLRKIKQDYPEIVVLVMTAHATVETAVEAMKLGAMDYLLKPFSTEELVIIMNRICEQLRIAHEVEYRRDKESERFGAIVGKSQSMMKVFELIRKVSPTDATVLLLGETGTGKELVAREIHKQSPRSNGPFIAVNCAAITETLLESELFGYEKGAFTGADKRKPGMFELARGGVLFLDEVVEIPIQLQAKLLRVLQEKQIYHIGGTTPISVDVRIIAATNQDIKKMVDEGHFRKDLYFRLSVFPINLPPLRERKEDIPLLIANFFSQKRQKVNISPDAMEILMSYRYPGNVRELENIIERALILSGGKEITPTNLPELEQLEEIPYACETTLSQMERMMLNEALKKAGGNKSEAAKLLGITRRMLYSRMKKYGMI